VGKTTLAHVSRKKWLDPDVFKVHFVNEDSDAVMQMRTFPLPPFFPKLPFNLKGDLGSFALLAEYGGIYLDADLLV
jgi:hypothetical protein